MTRRIEAQLVRGLEKFGYVEDKYALTTKYRVFEHPDCRRKMYVGSKGALRNGHRLLDSVVVGPDFRNRILKAGDFVVQSPTLEEFAREFA